MCIEMCSRQAITAVTAGVPIFDREECIHCGACIWNCGVQLGEDPAHSNIADSAGSAACTPRRISGRVSPELPLTNPRTQPVRPVNYRFRCNMSGNGAPDMAVWTTIVNPPVTLAAAMPLLSEDLWNI
jgi:hypothetical protein